MKRALAALILGCGWFVAACAGSIDAGPDDASDGDSDDTSTDDDGGCNVRIDFDPPAPLIGMHPQLRAIADADLPGVIDYQWQVRHNGTAVDFLPAQANTDQAIRFDIPETGVYDVTVLVPNCGEGERSVAVEDPQADFADLRLRVIPPTSIGAPPIDRVQRVYGGGDKLVTAYLDSGIVATTRVEDAAGGGVAAYLRFSPVSMPAATVEAFSASTGDVSPTLLAQEHSVLVIPTSNLLAPKKLTGWDASASAATPLVVDTGTAIAGTVVDGTGAGIAGATVQLEVAGVPTTYGTTTATGAFTVRSSVISGFTKVSVTPPATTGLPRLEASSSALVLSQPVAIAYASTIAPRDVGGTTITRTGGLANARVVFTGSFDAGTVQTGASAPVTMTGSVRVTLTTDASGDLPAALVPDERLTAVITAGPGDVAVTAVDLTASVPATIAAAPMMAFTTSVRTPTTPTTPSVAADRAELEAVPIGDLADGGAQAVRFTANASGTITGSLAVGGRYQLRFRDPKQRGAPRVVEVEADAIASTYTLVTSLDLIGSLVVSDSDVALDNAIIQILCGSCQGIDRERPLVETVSVDGEFKVAVPDVELD
jgi:hypothetical protein